ncbi:MAG TPA: hypothetical protein VF418_15285 [Sphingomonadaceae bacterium]
MTGSLARSLAGALTACALAAFAPAQAAPRAAAYYQATLASPLAEPRREILDGVVWTCANGSCAGTRSGSRAVIVCGRLARRVGEIAGFTAAGDALGAEDLVACNKG